jgi:hypothetical protein
MGRSRALVKGSGWRVLGIVLVGTILSTAFQAVASVPLALLLVVDPGPILSQVLNVTVQVLATVLVTPFTAALTMALYVDLRVRKEGFDLVLWAQRLGSVPPEGGFPAQPGAPTVVPAWGPPPPPPPPPPSPSPPPVGWGPPSASPPSGS